MHMHTSRYVAYNKPEAVIDWLEHQTPEEEYLVVLDSDMTLRHPFLVEDMHPSPGWAIGARYACIFEDRPAPMKTGLRP